MAHRMQNTKLAVLLHYITIALIASVAYIGFTNGMVYLALALVGVIELTGTVAYNFFFDGTKHLLGEGVGVIFAGQTKLITSILATCNDLTKHHLGIGLVVTADANIIVLAFAGVMRLDGINIAELLLLFGISITG